MHDGSQRSYHQRSHVQGGVVLSCAKLEESEGRLRESDLVLWPKNAEDMTFILKDQSTAASDGAPRNLHPSLSLWNVGGRGHKVEILFCCLSSFICFIFVIQGGVHSIGPPTLMYIMYIYCASVYII